MLQTREGLALTLGQATDDFSQGYGVIRGLYSPERCDEFLAALGPHATPSLWSISDYREEKDELDRTLRAFSDEATGPVESFTGLDLRLETTSAERARCGVATHTDHPGLDSDDDRILLLVALEHVTPQHANLYVFSDTHLDKSYARRLDAIPHGLTFEESHRRKRAILAGLEPLHIALGPGDGLVFYDSLVHGSTPSAPGFLIRPTVLSGYEVRG